MTDLSLLDLILMANLFLSGSFTYSSRILFLFGFLVCCTGLIHVRIFISSLCLFRSPVGVKEPILILRSLHLFRGTRRYHKDYGTYTGIAEHILIREYP